MADNVRFLSGGIGNLDKQPITPGNIYFALSDDKTYGYIVYDFKDSDNSNSRIVMSAKAKTAGQVEFPLVIGEHSYDGSERIEIPIYDGSSESGGECFDIGLLDNMLVLDNDKIWLFKDGKIDKTAPVDFGLAANESIKALSDRLNNIESDYLTTTDKDQVVKLVSNEALERKAQIGNIGDTTVKKYVDDKSYEVDTKIDKLNNSISSEVTARQAADDVLTARMDTFTSLAEGSTTSDAELADIRVKADGTTADTAGNAVREQISELKGDLDDLKAIEYSDLELAIIEDGNLNFSNVGSLNSDGTVKSQDTGYSTSDYIDTTKLYGVFRYGTGDTRFNKLQYAEYDENKNLIGSVHEVTVDYDFETYDGKIGVFYKTTYPNTAYIRIVSNPSWGQSHLLLRNKNIYTVDGELKDYIPKNSIRTNSENDVRYFPLIGKKIVCFGDSITEGIGSTNITYPEVIADYTKAIVYNVGIGGQTYIKVVNEDHDAFVAPMLVKAIIDNDWSNIDAHINYLSARAKEHIALLKTIDFNDIDIVTFAYGTNDWNMIVNSNAYDMSTHWYDSNQYRYIEYAFKETIEPLLTAYPHLKIYVFTPCFRSRQELNDGKDSDNYPKVYSQDSSEKYLYEYCDFLESLAEKYHIPCKNVYRDGNLSLVNSNYYLVDGVHRNDLGYKLLGEQYAKFILSN